MVKHDHEYVLVLRELIMLPHLQRIIHEGRTPNNETKQVSQVSTSGGCRKYDKKRQVMQSCNVKSRSPKVVT